MPCSSRRPTPRRSTPTCNRCRATEQRSCSWTPRRATPRSESPGSPRTPRKSGKVKVATFDADPQQMQMLSSGTIQLAIAQAPALEGKDAVDQAMNALTGKPVTKNILTPLVAITTSNMHDPKVTPYVYVSSC